MGQGRTPRDDGRKPVGIFRDPVVPLVLGSFVLSAIALWKIGNDENGVGLVFCGVAIVLGTAAKYLHRRQKKKKP